MGKSSKCGCLEITSLTPTYRYCPQLHLSVPGGWNRGQPGSGPTWPAVADAVAVAVKTAPLTTQFRRLPSIPLLHVWRRTSHVENTETRDQRNEMT